MAKPELLAALSECTFAEREEIIAAAKTLNDDERAQVLAQAQQMGIVKPRKPRGNAKHAEAE